MVLYHIKTLLLLLGLVLSPSKEEMLNSLTTGKLRYFS
jgi:hypothetical protein